MTGVTIYLSNWLINVMSDKRLAFPVIDNSSLHSLSELSQGSIYVYVYGIR